MKWDLIQPEYGDIIRIKSGSIYHYGIYVSDDEVIQFGLAPLLRPNIKDCDIQVCVTDIDGFINGGFVEVGVPDKKECKKRRSPEKCVEIARSRIGEKGYNILHNNCEHFVNECAFGERYSSQTASIRDLFKNFPIVDLYIAQLPECDCTSNLFPLERNREVFDTTHELTRRQRYYVWKLLEYAIDRSFGIKIKDVVFVKHSNGKWTADKFCFSLSHSKNGLAVGVSRKDIGVDIEEIHSPKSEQFAKKILTEQEFSHFEGLPQQEKSQYLIKMWTVKEAVFKMGSNDVFSPSKISPNGNTVTQSVVFDNTEFAVSVASNDVKKLRVYTVDSKKLV